jgi:hypothetical protein
MTVSKYEIAIMNDRCVCIIKEINANGYVLVNLFDTPRDEKGITPAGHIFKVQDINVPSDCDVYTFGNIGISENQDFEDAFKITQKHLANVMLEVPVGSLPIKVGAISINESGVAGIIDFVPQGRSNTMFDQRVTGRTIEKGISITDGKLNLISKGDEWVGFKDTLNVILYPKQECYYASYAYESIKCVLDKIKKEFLLMR